MATSERKVAANRENGKKSRGPITAEGKSRSRRNAVKHGLAGSITMPTVLQKQAEARVSEWTEALEPQGPVEKWLIARAASHAVRIETATNHARAADIKRYIKQSDRRKQSAEIIRLAYELRDTKKGHEPLLALRSTVGGLDWLIKTWEEMLQRTTRSGELGWGDLHLAARMLGSSIAETEFNHETRKLTFDYLCSCRPSKRYELMCIRIGESLRDQLPQDDAAFHEEYPRAMGRIKHMMSRQIAENQARREEVRQVLRSKPDTSLVDLSPEGHLLHRYEAKLDNQLQMAFRLFESLRRTRVNVKNQK